VTPPKEISNAAVNEITKQGALCWQDPDALDDIVFQYRFFIIDNEGTIIYSSDENLPGSLQSAIRQGFLPMDITVDSVVVGKAVIEVYPENNTEIALQKLSQATLIIFVLLCILTVSSLLILHFSVIKPFLSLEDFAHKISTGRFEEPLPMDRNNIFGLFTQSFDVMRSSLLEAQQKQHKAERAQKELIASLNHDIKTPVTSIRLTSELLQADTGISPKTAEKLKLIDVKADQISRLVDDMLHSTLEEMGELKVNATGQQSSVLADIFKSADILAKTCLGEIPPCLIEIDSIRMEQVIGNVITNSYKYAQTDIDVSFMILENFLHMSINDYGNGVAPEELELICTKFYRDDNAKKLNKEGEGLGLYIARQLMEKMGGGLEPANRDDGFTVRIWIRLTR